MQALNFQTAITTLNEFPLRLSTANGYELDYAGDNIDTAWSDWRSYSADATPDNIYRWAARLSDNNVEVARLSALSERTGKGLNAATKTQIRSETQRIAVVAGQPIKTDYGRIALTAVFPDLWTDDQIATEITAFLSALLDPEVNLARRLIIERSTSL